MERAVTALPPAATFSHRSSTRDDPELRNAGLRIQGRVALAFQETALFENEAARVRCRIYCIAHFIYAGDDSGAIRAVESIRESTLPEGEKRKRITQAEQEYVRATLNTAGNEEKKLPQSRIDALLARVRGSPDEILCLRVLATYHQKLSEHRRALRVLHSLPRSLGVLEILINSYLSLYREPDVPVDRMHREISGAFADLLPPCRSKKDDPGPYCLRHLAYFQMAKIAFLRNALTHGIYGVVNLPDEETAMIHSREFTAAISRICRSAVRDEKVEEAFKELAEAESIPTHAPFQERCKRYLIEAAYACFASGLADKGDRKKARALLKRVTDPDLRSRPLMHLGYAWIKTKHLEDACALLKDEVMTAKADRSQLRAHLALALVLSNLDGRNYSNTLNYYSDKDWKPHPEKTIVTLRRGRTPLSEAHVESAIDALTKISSPSLKERTLQKLIEIFFHLKVYDKCYFCLKEGRHLRSVQEQFRELMRAKMMPRHRETSDLFTSFSIAAQNLFTE